MLWTFSGIMLLTIAVTFLGSKTYTSEAKLFVRLGRESVALDPTATTGQVINVNESRENEINSVFELLKSRVVLAQVVAAVGPQVVLERDSTVSNVHTAGMFQSLNPFAPYSIEDNALKYLTKHLRIKAVKKTKIINVAYDAESPELAQAIVTSLIDNARDAHMRVNRTDGSQDFFATQTSHLREQLAGLETKLCEMKNASGISSLPDQRVINLQQIAELDNTLLKTSATLRASTAELQAHADILKRTPETVSLSETAAMPHSAVEDMREQLFALQVREKELLSMGTEENPRVKRIRAQVAAVREALDNEREHPQLARGLNPAHQEIGLAALKGEASIASLQAHAATLREQLLPAREQLVALNNQELQIERLEREIELAKINYKRYAENLEQSRIDAELETRNISNLNVLQPPTYSITPTRPRRALNLSLGLIGAMVSSVGVGLFLEKRRLGLKHSSEYDELLSAPTNGRSEQCFTEESGNGSIPGDGGELRK
jgi:uncharacterized protein involved in exopolysaccharide biosynthesis